MSEFSVDVYLSDAQPSGLGNLGPATGAYKVKVIGADYRQSRKSSEMGIFLDCQVQDEGEWKDTIINVSLMLADKNQSKSKRDVRTAEMKAALIGLGHPKSDVVNKTGTLKLSQQAFLGRAGHIWYERGNPAAVEKKYRYPVRTFVEEGVYTDIQQGKMRPNLRNTGASVIVRSSETASTEGTLGTDPNAGNGLGDADFGGGAVPPGGGLDGLDSLAT